MPAWLTANTRSGLPTAPRIVRMCGSAGAYGQRGVEDQRPRQTTVRRVRKSLAALTLSWVFKAGRIKL